MFFTCAFRKTATARGAAAAGLLAAALLAAGCGISDYNNELQSEQKYLQDVDLANEVLGMPASLPSAPKKEKEPDKKEPGKPPQPVAPVPALTAEVFFRPPKGFLSQGEEEAPGIWNFAKDTTPLPKAGPGGALPLGVVGKAAFLKVALAFSAKDPKDKFENDVTSYFSTLDRSKREVKHFQPGGHKPMTFELLTDPGATHSLYAYFYSAPPYQAAVIFRVDPAQVAALTELRVNKVRDACLESLAVGPEASRRRLSFRPPRPAVPKPAAQ